MDNTEIWTICDECETPRERVRAVREPDGAVYLLCDGCLAAIEDTVDLLVEGR